MFYSEKYKSSQEMWLAVWRDALRGMFGFDEKSNGVLTAEHGDWIRGYLEYVEKECGNPNDFLYHDPPAYFIVDCFVDWILTREADSTIALDLKILLRRDENPMPFGNGLVIPIDTDWNKIKLDMIEVARKHGYVNDDWAP